MVKQKIYDIAEDLAYVEYSCGFYALTDKEKAEIWKKAEEQFNDEQHDRVDYLRKSEVSGVRARKKFK